MTKEELLKRKKELSLELKNIRLQLSEIENKEWDENNNIKLDIVHKSSELIEAINHRYKNTGMCVKSLYKNFNDKTFTLVFGEWKWKGKKEFIGKQYFKEKAFTNGSCDGYDDPELFISEIANVKSFGSGGISTDWYRNDIQIPDDFEFDVELR